MVNEEELKILACIILTGIMELTDFFENNKIEAIRKCYYGSFERFNNFGAN